MCIHVRVCVCVFGCVCVHAYTHVYTGSDNSALRIQPSNELEHQRLEEYLQTLLKLKKLVTQQKDLKVKL